MRSVYSITRLFCRYVFLNVVETLLSQPVCTCGMDRISNSNHYTQSTFICRISQLSLLLIMFAWSRPLSKHKTNLQYFINICTYFGAQLSVKLVVVGSLAPKSSSDCARDGLHPGQFVRWCSTTGNCWSTPVNCCRQILIKANLSCHFMI